MNYLITHPDFPPFLTNWFDYPNHFIEGMVIYDMTDQTYTVDGRNWEDIRIDRL